MTRLHYPREFQQQSPAVLLKKTRVLSQNWDRFDHSAINQTQTAITMPKGPKSRAARVRSGFGNGRINDLHLARQLARLAATANIRQGQETVLSTPKYFKRVRFHSNPLSESPILKKRKVIQVPVCRESFSLVLGRDA